MRDPAVGTRGSGTNARPTSSGDKSHSRLRSARDTLERGMRLGRYTLLYQS
jgi:hypothetical protein